MTYKSVLSNRIRKYLPLPAGASLNISFLLGGLALGLVLSLIWRVSLPAGADETGTQWDRVQGIIESLETEQHELKADLYSVRQELATRQQSAAADTDRLKEIQAELDRQRLLAGLVAVEGPGVVVTVEDSAVPLSPAADPNAYIIHEYDLRDIVNLLWLAGSEAMAINGERLVSSSSVYCVGSTVMVNTTRLSPPYVIRAIGDRRTQLDYLRNPSYLTALKEKQRLYGVRFEVGTQATVRLPAYDGGFLIRYARPGE